MTDADYAKQKSRIGAMVDKWLSQLGLKWWSIDLTFHREGIPTTDARDIAAGWTINGTCEAKWEYLKATIAFNMPNVAGMDDCDLERFFVHECCHILVNEMCPSERTEESWKHEERVVAQLTKAFLWTDQQVGRKEINAAKQRDLPGRHREKHQGNGRLRTSAKAGDRRSAKHGAKVGR